MKKLFFLFSISLLILSGSVYAATQTTTMQVQASVPGTATVSATNFDFGELDPVDNTLSSSQITVTATTDMPYTIDIDEGLHGTVPARQMSDGSTFIPYKLFQDALGNTEWGTYFAGQGGSLLNATGTGAAQNFPVYGGAMPYAEGTNDPGTYVDTVTITVAY